MLNLTDTYKNLKSKLPKDILSGKRKIIVGFSGGPDSRFLLDFLFSSISNSKENIIVAHINYKLRFSESDHDENLVKKVCKKNNLNLENFTYELSKNSKGIQEKARNLRLKVFKKLSEKYKTQTIFLGHNLNDHVETILLNVIRGSGIKGLEGIKNTNKIKFEEKELLIYRPLIDLKKSEIKSMCDLNGLKYSVDSSNDENKYSRNLLRNKIIPEMEKINSNFIESINNLSSVAKKENIKKKIKFGKFKNLNLNHGVKILSDEYRNYYHTEVFLEKIHHEMFEKILLEKSFSENLPGNIKVYRRNEEILFKNLNNCQKTQTINKRINIPGKTLVFDNFQILTRVINKPENFVHKNKNIIYMNEKFVNETLFVRERRNGDKINSLPKTQTRVKKILSNDKSIINKKNTLILESKKEVLWIIGIKQSISSYVDKKNKKVLEVGFLKNPI